MTHAFRIPAVSALSLVALFALRHPAGAQEITGNITGTVSDQSGGVLPGVTVTATQTQTGLTKEAVTSENGVYAISYLPVGTYQVAFVLSGFKTFTATQVELHVNDRIE